MRCDQRIIDYFTLRGYREAEDLLCHASFLAVVAVRSLSELYVRGTVGKAEYRCLRYAIVCIGETNFRLTDSSAALRKILTSVQIESGSLERTEQRKFISTEKDIILARASLIALLKSFFASVSSNIIAYASINSEI